MAIYILARILTVWKFLFVHRILQIPINMFERI